MKSEICPGRFFYDLRCFFVFCILCFVILMCCELLYMLDTYIGLRSGFGFGTGTGTGTGNGYVRVALQCYLFLSYEYSIRSICEASEFS